VGWFIKRASIAREALVWDEASSSKDMCEGKEKDLFSTTSGEWLHCRAMRGAQGNL
jgi:hypothetical protein